MSRNIHHLRTWPIYFEAVLAGEKPFELRKNDRDFRAGDTVHLDEWDPRTKEYTGRTTVRAVTYVLINHEGLAPGYVVLGTT